MNKRSALHTREDAAVKVLCELLTAHDETAARPTQCLMRRCRDKLAMWDRRWMQTYRHKPGNVGDIGHHLRVHAPRDLANTFEVDRSRIGGCSADQKFWLVLFSDTLELVVIDLLRLAIHAIVSDLVINPRKIQWVPVRQMPAVREVHPENLIPMLERRQQHRHVRLCTGVRLDVRMLG